MQVERPTGWRHDRSSVRPALRRRPCRRRRHARRDRELERDDGRRAQAGVAGLRTCLRRRQEGFEMKLYANSDIPVGRVLISQNGEGFICRLTDLRYQPGDDDGTEMIVNPADVEAARAMWFEPKGR